MCAYLIEQCGDHVTKVWQMFLTKRNSTAFFLSTQFESKRERESERDPPWKLNMKDATQSGANIRHRVYTHEGNDNRSACHHLKVPIEAGTHTMKIRDAKIKTSNLRIRATR